MECGECDNKPWWAQESKKKKTMIEDTRVSVETAELLKEKGFPQDPNICNYAYTSRGRLSNNAKSFMHKSAITVPSRCYTIAPTLQTANEWLIENYGLYVSVDFEVDYDEDERGTKHYYEPSWYWNVYRMSDRKQMTDCDTLYSRHALALESGIKYCLTKLI